MIQLVPILDPAEFAACLEQIARRFAAANAPVEHRPVEEALAAARARHAETWAQGPATAGHFLRRIVDREGIAHGSCWYALAPRGEAYLYDIFIEEDARRRGFGRAALRAIEEELRRAGCRQLWLNVFAANEGAVRFYERCGYQLGTMHFAKLL